MNTWNLTYSDEGHEEDLHPRPQERGQSLGMFGGSEDVPMDQFPSCLLQSLFLMKEKKHHEKSKSKVTHLLYCVHKVFEFLAFQILKLMINQLTYNIIISVVSGNVFSQSPNHNHGQYTWGTKIHKHIHTLCIDLLP